MENNTKDFFSKKYLKQPTLRALINAIPYIGGSLDILLSIKGNEFANNRIEKFITLTEEKLNQINEENLDYEFLKSEQFFEIFQETIEKVKHTYDDEKLEILRNAFINSIKIENTGNPLVFSFLEIIHVLGILQIKVLRRFSNEKYLGRSENKESRFSRIANDLGITYKEIGLITEDLLRVRLIEKQGVGKYGAGDGWNAISNFGKAFIKFILD